jgi:two-component system, OmpR family, response regulator
MHRVFVVDDEQDIVEILVEYLEAESFEAVGSSDPAHAQEAIAAAQPEIVLLDIMMPEVDGYEVARRMKADLRTAAIPIIFLTGKERQDDDLRFSKSSGDLFIRKPIPLPELKESVLFMIENQPTTGQ